MQNAHYSRPGQSVGRFRSPHIGPVNAGIFLPAANGQMQIDSLLSPNSLRRTGTGHHCGAGFETSPHNRASDKKSARIDNASARQDPSFLSSRENIGLGIVLPTDL